MLLGVIGDDFTGSSDIGNVLARGGMGTVQYVGIPKGPAQANVEAGIVSLKTRSASANDAIHQSLAALHWLRAQGCRQFVFKYCSTFDSTPEGNIGPVGEALADALDALGVIACPAFPRAGRTIYQGHMFVGDRLLNESGMENHPLNPMTDASLVRWLERQAQSPVGFVPANAVWAGPASVRAALDREAERGCRLVIADATRDDDLFTLGRAAANDTLLTGGSGIALGLPENFRSAGQLAGKSQSWQAQGEGRAAILSGSCSNATRRQIEAHAESGPSQLITADEIISGSVSAAGLADWALAAEGNPLIYTSSDPETVSAAQKKHGGAALAARIESLFADIARLLVAGGVTRLIVAGGETSGAVVEGLGLEELVIGPEIDPGVPALRAGPNLTLALKSGNFGTDDFFEKADAVLGRGL